MGAVRDFLSTNKVSQLPLRRGKVYEATTSMDLRAAFDLLVNNRILSVPVWDEETKTYIGMLTVRDLVSFAVFATAENNAVKTLEDILRHGVGHFGLAQDAVTVSCTLLFPSNSGALMGRHRPRPPQPVPPAYH